MEEGGRDLKKEGLLGRNHSLEDKIEERPEDWCGRLFVKKNCFNNAFYLFKYIFVWWDLATTYIKEWNLFWAQIWPYNLLLPIGQ